MKHCARRLSQAFLSICMFSLSLPVQGQEPRISQVLEYRPAPGQFMHTAVMASEGVSTRDALLAQARKRIVEEHGMLSLGSWGGYIVCRMEPALPNHPGQNDFSVRGNAFMNGSEPGVIYVSRDANENGLADDPWYEIKGSEYDNSRRDYEVTYYRPKDALKDPVVWSDSEGASGSIARNAAHTANAYYPAWEGASVTFRGVRLPDNMKQNPNSGFWEFAAFEHGYADNHPNGSAGAEIDIDSAVDERGAFVRLDRIDFIKIQTGVLHSNDITGEASTEFSGILPIGKNAPAETPVSLSLPALSIEGNNLLLHGISEPVLVTLYAPDGSLLSVCSASSSPTAEIALPEQADAVIVRIIVPSSGLQRSCKLIRQQ